MSAIRWMAFALILMMAFAARSAVFETGILPGVMYRGQTISVLRLNSRLLFGNDFLWVGPYGDYQSLSPQVTDTSYGAAFRIGKDIFFEMQGGYFRRSFRQTGTDEMTGAGFTANLILGFHLAPYAGIDLALMGKRISNGDLERRWIVDFLPLITVRGEF